MKKIKVMSVFGTRPEAIKMAPLVRELASRPQIESLCCLTGQHREMLDSVMDIFRLRGDYDLNIMEKQQTLELIFTERISSVYFRIIREESSVTRKQNLRHRYL